MAVTQTDARTLARTNWLIIKGPRISLDAPPDSRRPVVIDPPFVHHGAGAGRNSPRQLTTQTNANGS
jgi:hypothetical protein